MPTQPADLLLAAIGAVTAASFGRRSLTFWTAGIIPSELRHGTLHARRWWGSQIELPLESVGAAALAYPPGGWSGPFSDLVVVLRLHSPQGRRTTKRALRRLTFDEDQASALTAVGSTTMVLVVAFDGADELVAALSPELATQSVVVDEQLRDAIRRPLQPDATKVADGALGGSGWRVELRRRRSVTIPLLGFFLITWVGISVAATAALSDTWWAPTLIGVLVAAIGTTVIWRTCTRIVMTDIGVAEMLGRRTKAVVHFDEMTKVDGWRHKGVALMLSLEGRPLDFERVEFNLDRGNYVPAGQEWIPELGERILKPRPGCEIKLDRHVLAALRPPAD